MSKRNIIIVIVLVVLVGGFFYLQSVNKVNDEEFLTGETVEEIAKDWVENNSPTYLYDGEDLSFIEKRGLDLYGCENCYEVEFAFTSRHAGYGDREGEALAQVITPHTIIVLVEDKEVTKVVTDQIYDEMEEKFFEEMTEPPAETTEEIVE
jgi:hypothetical protein